MENLAEGIAVDQGKSTGAPGQLVRVLPVMFYPDIPKACDTLRGGLNVNEEKPFKIV